MDLLEIADSPELLEIGRRAIEETLIEWRDSRLSQLRNNGLVIKERDGQESSVIRFGPETALSIGLKAIHDHLQRPTAEGEKDLNVNLSE